MNGDQNSVWHQGTRAILEDEGSSPGKEGREEGTGRTADSCAWERNQPQIAGKAPHPQGDGGSQRVWVSWGAGRVRQVLLVVLISSKKKESSSLLEGRVLIRSFEEEEGGKCSFGRVGKASKPRRSQK